MYNEEYDTGTKIPANIEKEINDKINELENKRVESAAFRARCNWELYGEKSNKYFFSLEKCNYASKTMFAVRLENGQICKEQKTILREQEKFYRNLYTSDNEIQFTITNQTGI